MEWGGWTEGRRQNEIEKQNENEKQNEKDKQVDVAVRPWRDW